MDWLSAEETFSDVWRDLCFLGSIGDGGWSAYTSSIYNFGCAYEVSCTYLEIKILLPAFVARWSPKAEGVFHRKMRSCSWASTH